jgi:hypothetical protein
MLALAKASMLHLFLLTVARLSLLAVLALMPVRLVD